MNVAISCLFKTSCTVAIYVELCCHYALGIMNISANYVPKKRLDSDSDFQMHPIGDGDNHW